MATPLIAAYKLYRGGEWLRASLESVRPFTDGAAVAISDSPWCNGTCPPENCTTPLAEFKLDHPDYPVTVTNGVWRHQQDQYDALMYFVRSRFGGDLRVLLVDSDEIWDAPDLERLLAYAAAHPHAAYCVPMRTYVKLPICRVAPPEPCRPTVLVDTGRSPKLLGVRGNAIPDRVEAPDVWMHHFSYVRKTFADILLKFRTSAIGDNVPSHNDWFSRVWDHVPDVRNFHPSIGHEACWRGLETVTLDDLPELARPVAEEILGNTVRS